MIFADFVFSGADETAFGVDGANACDLALQINAFVSAMPSILSAFFTYWGADFVAFLMEINFCLAVFL